MVMVANGLHSRSVPEWVQRDRCLGLLRVRDFLSAFDTSQRQALALLFLRLHGEVIGLAETLRGLAMFPFGLLAYKSGSWRASCLSDRRRLRLPGPVLRALTSAEL